MSEPAFDSYIFDMDGTLWDAVPSYCAIWNRTIEQLGIDAEEVTPHKLKALMGCHIDAIYESLIGTRADRSEFLSLLEANEASMMPVLGGTLYSGVRQVLQTLGKRARLFMVSNCQADGLPNFVAFNGLDSTFVNLLSYGVTGKEKDVNISALKERYNLKEPLYIGDTQGDCNAAHRAGVPFAWAAYGFGGDVEGYDYKLESINDLPLCKPINSTPK